MTKKQFAALPFRITDGEVEVCLISTRKKKRWSVPKGSLIKRTSPRQTAATEAFEEAGLFGDVGKLKIATFKQRVLHKGRTTRGNVDVFPFRVMGEAVDWPEKHQRELIWVPPQKAVEMVRKPGLKRTIIRFAGSMERHQAPHGEKRLHEHEADAGPGRSDQPKSGTTS
jgi:8-oxo-dGTP pyrophosphatase MutT (NUDIX family)